MGDRSQIAVKHSEGRIYLYSHWDGALIYQKLARVLARRDRWTDEEYLTRMILSEMVKDSIDKSTGYGIGLSEHGDIEHPIPVLDVSKGTISWEGPEHKEMSNMTFDEFISIFG